MLMRLNNNRWIVWVMACAAIACAACSQDVAPPAIEGVSPGHQASVRADAPVTVDFSEPMDRERTEGAFSLTSSEGMVAGSFRWENDDRRLVFLPELPLANGRYYTVRVTTAARDRAGNALTVEYLSSFLVGDDLAPPEVVAISPENLTRAFPLDGVIRIEFSEPMDRMSVERGVRFTPSIPGTFVWTSDTVVEYRPFAPLVFATDYQITISTACTDLAGNGLLATVESFFTAGDEFERPRITSLVDTSSGTDLAAHGNFHEYDGISHAASLRVRFSEPVDRASFRDALSLSPSAEHQVEWNDASDGCTISFPRGLVSLQRYELRVNRTLRDTAGNEMAEVFVAYAVIDAVASRPPAIAGVWFADRPLTDDTESDYYNHLGVEFSSDSTYQFRVAFDRDVDRVSVHDGVFCSFMNGEQDGTSAIVRSYRWDAAHPNSVLTVTLGSIEGGNLYLLEFKGGENGIRGLHGVPMTATRRYFFRFDADD